MPDSGAAGGEGSTWPAILRIRFQLVDEFLMVLEPLFTSSERFLLKLRVVFLASVRRGGGTPDAMQGSRRHDLL